MGVWTSLLCIIYFCDCVTCHDLSETIFFFVAATVKGGESSPRGPSDNRNAHFYDGQAFVQMHLLRICSFWQKEGMMIRCSNLTLDAEKLQFTKTKIKQIKKTKKNFLMTKEKKYSSEIHFIEIII